MALKKFDSLNVIPLVDIMLVLLAIVLTTATLVEKKLIPVNLPKAKSAKNQIRHKNIAITISKDGKIYIENNETTLKDFEAKIKKFDKNSTFLINCDANASFNNFVKVLDTLKSNSFNNISIVTKEDE